MKPPLHTHTKQTSTILTLLLNVWDLSAQAEFYIDFNTMAQPPMSVSLTKDLSICVLYVYIVYNINVLIIYTCLLIYDMHYTVPPTSGP